jgi:hypothetical protein
MRDLSMRVCRGLVAGFDRTPSTLLDFVESTESTRLD